MRRRIKKIIPAIIVFIVSLIVGVEYLLHSDLILVTFNIQKVDYASSNISIVFDEVKAAKKYVVTISDSNNRKVFEREIKKNKYNVTLENLEYGMTYSVMVYAYDRYGDVEPCEKEYLFTWDEPTFNNEQSLVLNNEDYVIEITGEFKKDVNYKIRLSEDGNILNEESIKDYSYKIAKEYYQDKSTILVIELVKDDKVVASRKLYNNLNPVGDVNIKTPTTDSIVQYNDLALSYEGGENSSEYIINVFRGSVLTKTSTTSKSTVILSKQLFEPTVTYTLEVIAKYQDFEKKAAVTITIADKEQHKPVYINKNWKHVKKGTKIELSCPDSDANIYYTTNGDDPTSMGIRYTEPIEITEDVVIKTVAMSDIKNSSIVKEYNISCSEKNTLKIYLSPSNQEKNYGVSSVGFTNECDEMNDLTDYIEERLLSVKGVEIMRNVSAGNINLWNQESNYFGADFKIAIHSNGSTDHKSRGIETWIYTEESETYSIANMIQKGLWTIYPYNDDQALNRGVKYANGALGEANDLYAPFQLLVEVAHHDDESDAKWIMENKKIIGYNIADSILRYFGMID